MIIIKRDGTTEKYDLTKISNAITLAFKTTNEYTEDNVNSVLTYFKNHFSKLNTVEEIQDAVEKSLIAKKFFNTAKEYILYRKQRSDIRESKNDLNKIFNEIANADAKDSDLKRENANQDGNAPMGLMLFFGSESEKQYVKRFLINPKYVKEHESGDFHIHDLNMYACTFNCCNIGLKDLLKKGFSTGHGVIREPQSIQSAMALTAIIIQSNQNDMFGGQGIPCFDYDLAPYVMKSFTKNLNTVISIMNNIDVDLKNFVESLYYEYHTAMSYEALNDLGIFINRLVENPNYVINKALEMTDKDTYQACQAFIHNLNTMQSRAGAQVPFSSINYGTNTTKEGRLIIKNILKATEDGLGFGETSIFPVQIFKTKEGINFNSEDPNYDLFEYACKVNAKRMYPNFVNIDVPYNLQYYRQGKPETEMATMGCRTRVIGQLGTKEGRVTNRGNIAFTTINLPRLAIKSKSISEFWTNLDNLIDDSIGELLERLKFLKEKKVYNFPFMMGQNVYLGSEKLKWEDSIEPALRNGSVSVGFIGLAECLIKLTGKHHGESQESWDLGYSIVKRIRTKCDEATKKYGWNFTCFATPAEGVSDRFPKLDKKEFGIIENVNDRKFYTNSFHIPVWFEITAQRKMELEGPFHELCNAGSISYVEMAGDATNNIKAIEKLVKYSKECSISYFSINTTRDTCPICGFNGIIESDTCPRCGWKEGTEISLEELEKKGISTKKFCNL